MWSFVTLGVLQLVVMVAIHNLGIRTMVIVYSAINILWLLVWYWFVRKETGYRFWHLAMDILPYLFITMAVMVATYLLTKPIVNIYCLLAAKIAIAAVLYILIMRLSNAVTFKETLEYIRRIK